jgi:hypothetical protein
VRHGAISGASGEEGRGREAFRRCDRCRGNAGFFRGFAPGGGLTDLQQAARSANAWPHGLWVLCPGEAKREAPQLDELRVEALTEAERVVLDRKFVHGPEVADRAS